MSFELGEPKQASETSYCDPKAPLERVEEYANKIGSHKDLFETISEVHYLPELGGSNDEALLESLVEKGCEDNQILGQVLEKLAHLVHGKAKYAEEEEDMLLSNAPVSDIIDRFEKTLESPGQSSITAAQGLLHLHHLGDHLAPDDSNQGAEKTYMTEEVFKPEETSQCPVETLQPIFEYQEADEVSHADYCINVEKINENEIGVANAVYTEPILYSKESYGDKKCEEPQSQLPIPDQNEVNTPDGRINDEPPLIDMCSRKNEQIEENLEEDIAEATREKFQQNTPPSQYSNDDYDKENSQESSNKDEQPTDLSTKQKKIPPFMLANVTDTSHLDDNMSGTDVQPRNLTVHRRLPTSHASPRRADVPRVPSRESDAMQSPQPSGIPAIPASPEIFTMPLTKSKQTLFLETLLSSPLPKMYTSEVTITKQQCEPLNLGKHRKSASPTVSSCSDEMKKLNKEFGEPQGKKLRRESTEDLAKISKLLRKCSEKQISKKLEKPHVQTCDESTPKQQFQFLKSSPEFHIPDPLLVPKNKLNSILAAPGREIPALLFQRPELRFDLTSPKSKEKESKPTSLSKTYTQPSTSQLDQTSQPKPIPSMDVLAGDIDSATSVALNQMLWLPYLSQLEAMISCSQNMDFLKILISSGYNGPNYPDLSQMFNPSSRFIGPGGFPMMPSMDYANRFQFSMWHKVMSLANTSSSQRPKLTTMADQVKELSKSTDVQNPFVHSTKNHSNKPHSSARTSPIAYNYSNQRSKAHNPFLQGMYPGMASNMRPNMIPGLQIPYCNLQMMGNKRSPRTCQQQSPTSPYYPNNYLQAKQSESQCHPQMPTTQEYTRPRISVKSLHNLMEPSAVVAASGVGSSRWTPSRPTSVLERRWGEPEVGSTTSLGEPPHMPLHPHDPSSFHLWHPLFGNQKSYDSPWNWTTVAATGD